MDALATLIGSSTLAAAAALAVKYGSVRAPKAPEYPRPLVFGRIYYVVPPNVTTVRSRKRDFQRLLMETNGVTSGRQWVLIRKRLPKSLRPFA